MAAGQSDTSFSSDDPGAAYLSVAQVARRLGCSVSLVQKWRRLGWLPATQLGPPEVPVYGYRPADVDRFAAERWNRRRGRPPGSGTRPAEADHPAAGTRDQGMNAPATSEPGPLRGLTTPHPETWATRSAALAPPPARNELPVHAEPPARNELPARADQAAEVMAPPRTASHAPPEAFAQIPPEAPASGAAAPAPFTGSSLPPALAPTPAPRHSIVADLPQTGRPLVIWDADPRGGTAIVLARFGASELLTALATAESWSQHYPDLVVGALVSPSAVPRLVATWRGSRRQRDPES